MGLFGKTKQKNARVNSVGEDLNHLTEKKELPFGWMVYNKEIINCMENELSVVRNIIRDSKTPTAKLKAYEAYFAYLKDGLKKYYLIGECEGTYFLEHICQSYETKNNLKRYVKLEEDLESD